MRLSKEAFPGSYLPLVPQTTFGDLKTFDHGKSYGESLIRGVGVEVTVISKQSDRRISRKQFGFHWVFYSTKHGLLCR